MKKDSSDGIVDNVLVILLNETFYNKTKLLPTDPLAMIPIEVLTSTHVIGNSCPVHIAIGVEPTPNNVNNNGIT